MVLVWHANVAYHLHCYFNLPQVNACASKHHGCTLTLCKCMQQVHSMIEKLAQSTDIRAALVVGGLSMQVQASTLKTSPEIVVATPVRAAHKLMSLRNACACCVLLFVTCHQAHHHVCLSMHRQLDHAQAETAAHHKHMCACWTTKEDWQAGSCSTECVHLMVLTGCMLCAWFIRQCMVGEPRCV